MATFGRSFKPPAYFSRARRPAPPGRTMSNSSDVSVASNRSEDHDHFIMSGLNTPAQEKTGFDGFKVAQPEMRSPRASPAPAAHRFPFCLPYGSGSAGWSGSPCGPFTAFYCFLCRLGQGLNPGSPVSPVGARGDIPGGYFPLHEDPKNRVHRPHPFQEGGLPRHHSVSVAVVASEAERRASRFNTMAPSTRLSPLTALDADHARANTPVASYLPSGAHHTSLPMGKYYPSNYENRPQEPRIGPSAPPVRVSSTRSEGHIPSRETFRSTNKDTEVRRKLAQYQRDMIAQARLAASEVLGSSAESSAASTVPLNGVPLPTLHIGGPGSHKPLSPRLLPLGSPGPVTPMNLEGEDVGGYLDSGRNDEIARVLRAEEERIRREGATSPAVETGPQAF
ncbi:hypothetical protein Cob_v011593 [Colletotrichum orbiculare MAFF 240422]|uniref:Uncharacterized protein n=1 Tax=Colletotrichum orbiculare (strain 104-T / ATCC 96160 / CBS 514.97 / LARS 414 / MAFF 240422) TaxID=1213857 RepID=A0A484FAQ7_COLOR|nr:hypothetical protein Cob_v011593 [Colletotrichum orbiculare MAFF 240422]